MGVRVCVIKTMVIISELNDSMSIICKEKAGMPSCQHE